MSRAEAVCFEISRHLSRAGRFVSPSLPNVFPDGPMSVASDDESTLSEMGYAQELARCLGGFSNFAISLSMICILAGGLTSFHLAFAAAGPGGVCLGWAAGGLFSLIVAATMGQLASAYPTAGGLYHWSSTLGGRGWGWVTAWFNLAGLIAVMAAINVGMVLFAYGAYAPDEPPTPLTQALLVALVTGSQAAINHSGMRVTRFLTDLSGYLILVVATALTISLFMAAPTLDFSRLWTLRNLTGTPAGDSPVWPAIESLPWAFALGLLLPAYTISGFDASAHTAEETRSATINVPKGIIRSVWVSGIFGWFLVTGIVLAIPDLDGAAEQGPNVFFHTLRAVMPGHWAEILLAGCVVAQYLCGLATVTSTSRMAFAFARDGGLPASGWLRKVSARFQTPAIAIWTVSAACVLFTIHTPVYSTITAVCTIFLYVSYVMPTISGFLTHGRTWTVMGPWQLGRWYRPLAGVSILGCVGLIFIGVQPPNDQAVIVIGAFLLALLIGWFARARKHFPGPPHLRHRL